MSKRRFIDDDEDFNKLNPYPKRMRNHDGSASAVNPLRFDPNFQEDNSLMSDEEDGMEKKIVGEEDDVMETDDATAAGSASFDTLLYQLASMDVGTQKEKEEIIETCPICVARVTLSQFPNHVYACLDRMDAGERSDWKSQLERDEEMAFSMVEQQPYRYSQDMSWQCPICNKVLSVGMSINVHANECLDAQEADEASDAMGKFSIQSNSNATNTIMDDDDDNMGQSMSPQRQMSGNNNNSNNRPKSMTKEQMSACANALLSNPKGSAEYESMLEMFETLGFNERNMRRAVEVGKRQKSGEGEEKDEGMMMTDAPAPAPPPSSTGSSSVAAHVGMDGAPPPPTPMFGGGGGFGMGGSEKGFGASGFGPGMFSNPSQPSAVVGFSASGDFGGGGGDISDSEL